MTAEEVKSALKKCSNDERALVMQRFFKTGEGQYGAGDIFIGASMPDTRKVAKEFVSLPFSEIQQLLNSEIHEHRMAGVLILAYKYPKATEADKQNVFDFYLYNVRKGTVNNWDLVDVTSPNIVGEHLADKPRDILFKLAESEDLWQKRVAMIATFAFIKKGDPSTTIKIAEILMNDTHDLIHKAVGWMLREMGKRVDVRLLTDFLEQHARTMPRTMLRYAIEKLTPEQKLHFMQLKNVTAGVN